MEDNNKHREVTNFIEPVLLTKLHIGRIGKSNVSDLMPLLSVIACEWRLKLNRVRDFRVAVKILEESVIKN
jgi:hypothetical protein